MCLCHVIGGESHVSVVVCICNVYFVYFYVRALHFCLKKDLISVMADHVALLTELDIRGAVWLSFAVYVRICIHAYICIHLYVYVTFIYVHIHN